MGTKEDLLKAVDSLGENPAIREVEATIKILDECIWKVEAVFLLPAVLANLGRKSAGQGGDLVGVLLDHQLLEERLANQQLRWLGAGEGEKGKTMLAGLEQELCGSFQNVLRCLRTDPAMCRGLSSEAIAEGSLKLTEGLRELQGLLVERQLMGTAEEQAERDRSRYLDELCLRHRNNLELVSALEEEVAAATKDKEEEISKKNQVIRKLKTSLLQMQKMSEDFATRTLKAAENQNLSDRKTSEGRCSSMQQEVNQLRAQLANLITENRDVELTLRRRNNKVESEIENWIQKYDADMGEKQVELEEVSVLYTQETEELMELEEHYAVLELEFSQIMEEKRLAQEHKEKEEREQVVKDQNAVVIQAYWRGFKVRKAMKGKNKGKKGKKGKGKKAK
ncbi:hypothetical protein AAFF_G00066470 [Aldrovandia affinis]|uniref:Dynein regulatory complex protein 10 n=1 Tax=Aldrovandia affinis TaxID=143900 RepID=A0AAD7T409_9TELE|nr:hypothetical protein AAFF_G00066470 [Aldrovandia affinis]